MKELITVIVPVHNGEKYLEKCIESIVMQDYEELEILVINDGSTDGTAVLCERLHERYGCLQVTALPDLGVSAARNRGIEQAKGEYLMFVDADDRLRPGVLRGLKEQLVSTGSDMAGCGFAVWGTQEEWETLIAEGRMPRELTGMQEAQTFDGSSYLREGILRGNTRCWSKLYRRSLIGPVRFREGLTVGEDMLFLVELLPRVRKVVETSYPGYGYYQNPGGVMQRPFTPAYMDQITCWEMAGERIVRQEASLTPQVNAQIMVAVMLTVGKLALLPEKERKKAQGYLQVCRKKLKGLVKGKECYSYLPDGYGIKVRMFAAFPRLYACLYRLQKERREKAA